MAVANGPCTPWVDPVSVQGAVAVQRAIAALAKAGNAPASDEVDAACQIAAQASSEILYELSGRVFSGQCGPVTVRPIARPTDRDARLAGPFGLGGMRAQGSLGVPPVISAYGSSKPPEVDLGVYPVAKVTLVKIDGVVIPANEYELRDHRTLVRMRPTAASVPTERAGWPTAQNNDLPDTEQGTFSITLYYGQQPPQTGVLAAAKLAEYLALPMFGDTTHYPGRVTSISRQGVSAMVTDVMDVLKTGGLGIYEVEAFLLATNPKKLARQAAVWSPDIGRTRRAAAPSTS